MQTQLHPVVGTIRLEPAVVELAGGDDSSLERLLESLAHHERLATAPSNREQPFRLIAMQRLCGVNLAHGERSVRANLAELIENLQDEYGQLQEIGFWRLFGRCYLWRKLDFRAD